LLWRLQLDRQLLEMASDEDVALARLMAKNFRRDAHKITAFVRFKEVATVSADRRKFLAWFEPDHHIFRRSPSQAADPLGVAISQSMSVKRR
ncbi:DUF4130 domain-containing protein, partial [Rhizobium ruizarguesonis]